MANTNLTDADTNKSMTLWLINAGRHGEQEEALLNENITAIGWEELPDLSSIRTKDDLKLIYSNTYFKINPNEKIRAMANRVGQIWKFVKLIEKGDLVATPLKSESSVMIGEIAGEYEYNENSENARHRRKIIWKKTFPRSDFDQDIRYGLGAYLTVGKIRALNAEERVKNMLEDNPILKDEDYVEEEPTAHDLEQMSIDEITEHIGKHFKGHNLAKLIDNILIAKGYTTQLSPPGADGGLDILVGSGKMGFANPKIGIQVKSQNSAIDVSVIRALKGSLSNFGVDYGILVTWGELTKDAEREIKKSFFTIKWWNRKRIIEELLENYSKMNENIQSDIPLKRIWTMTEE